MPLCTRAWWVGLACCCCAVAPASVSSVALPPSVVAFWDFQNATQVQPGVYEWADRLGGGRAVLHQHNASFPVARVATDGVFGAFSVEFQRGQRLVAARASVPVVTGISGPAATVSVVAWVKLLTPLAGGAFVGGVWEEYNAGRQFALFLDGTGGCPEKDGVVAHISAEGGPSPGEQYCRSRACGATTLPTHAWHCIANVYNGSAILAYVNGTLDAATTVGAGGSGGGRGESGDNPFLYPNPPKFPNGGIYTPSNGTVGSDLALGANFVHPGGGTGPGVLANMFVGRVGGFAVANKALSADEVVTLCAAAQQ